MAAKKKKERATEEHVNTDKKNLEQIKELLKVLVKNSEEVKTMLEKLKDRFV